jgi:hypothetical protein
MSFGGVASQIVGTDIGFGFNNFPGEVFSPDSANQNLTQEVGSNVKCGTGVEGAG